MFAALVMRELRLSARHGADTLGAVLFFLLAGALFPLAVGPAPEVLARMAPGIVWVCALLAALLPLDRLLGADLEDGSLDQVMLSGLPAPAVALAKALAHWIVTGVPLLLAAGPLAVMLQMPTEALAPLLAGLAVGTLVLSLLGTMAAAIVLGARRGGGGRGDDWDVAAATSAAARRNAGRRFAALSAGGGRGPARRRGLVCGQIGPSPLTVCCRNHRYDMRLRTRLTDRTEYS